MKSNISLLIGILLVFLGLIFIANTLQLWKLESSWPVIYLFVGIGFVLAYFLSPNSAGMLMPATIMIFSSVPLLLCSVTDNWHWMVKLWPLFLLGPAAGFFAMYFGGIKEKGLLLPGFILTGVAAVFFLAFNYLSFFWPILFLVAGAILIYIGIKDKGRNTPNNLLSGEPASTEKANEES